MRVFRPFLVNQKRFSITNDIGMINTRQNPNFIKNVLFLQIMKLPEVHTLDRYNFPSL